MRAASRLLAAVKQGQYLEVGAPTGLTGLYNHGSPRSTLVYLYSSTLDKLKQMPESSVYRQSTEALTAHRLKIVESVKPAGYAAWKEKVGMQLADDPAAFYTARTSSGTFVQLPPKFQPDFRSAGAAWDGEREKPQLEGLRSQAERRGQAAKLAGLDKNFAPERAVKQPHLDPEPPLTVDQISDLESQLGAGLIEEVIQVAEGEHRLVDTMVEARVWEDLAEKAPEGQWSYFERGAHTKTQNP